MRNIIKASLIVAAFLFAAGCTTQAQPSVHQDTLSNANAKVKVGKHPTQMCKGKACTDKLGGSSYQDDTTK